MIHLPWFGWLILLGMLIYVSINDYRTHTIHRYVTFGGVIFGVIANTIEFGSRGAIASIVGMGGMFLFSYPLYRWMGMGWGDVELYVSLGGIFGAEIGFSIFACANLAILIYTLPKILTKAKVKNLPLAPFISTGTVVAILLVSYTRGMF